MNSDPSRPIVSILVPTYQRPAMLQRNLQRCAQALQGVEDQFEVLVGDNAADPTTQHLVESWKTSTAIPTQYLGKPTADMEANHQRLLEAARGDWVQIVHDDDYLLPGAGKLLLATAAESADCTVPVRHAVMLVDLEENCLRVEGRDRERCLSAHQAVLRLLSESSFIRVPAMLLPRQALVDAGGFDRRVGLIFDLATWLALTSRQGLRIVPRLTVAYTRHSQADTNSMFTEAFVHKLLVLLRFYANEIGLSKNRQTRLLGRFLWRFGLAGCLRAWKRKDRAALKERLALLQHEAFQTHPCPMMWRGLHCFLWAQSFLGKRP